MFSFGLTDLQAAEKAPPLAASVAMDEDAQKRNTDCIYFLASPLSCKKGKNCEYRHSEAARKNPRDCWFWKSGNGLNSHCLFRHLPLEGKSSSASIASISTAPVPESVSATSTAVAAGPSKSKTPCYFFSQGYCAKNDKCAFMHGLPVASSSSTPAGAPSEQNSVTEVNGKAGHACGRPLIVLNQNGVISQGVQPPVINVRLEALKKTQPISSRPPLSMQGAPQSCNGSERATHSERVANFAPSRGDEDSRKSKVRADRFHDVPGLANRSRNSNASKNVLLDQANCQGLSQTGHFRKQSRFQSKDLRKDGPAGGVLHASPPRNEEGEYSLQSDNQEGPMGINNSPVWDSDHKYAECKRQRKESEGDLRNHLAKRMKVNSSLHTSMEKGGHPGSATHCHGDARLSNDHLKKKKQQQGENSRNSIVEAESNGAKRAQFLKRGSSDVPIEAAKCTAKKVQSRSFSPSFSSLTFKCSTSENVKETIAFDGPKSLAQIKAEKMARGASASNAIERLDSSAMIPESGSELASGKLAVTAESQDAAVSIDKLLTFSKGVSTIKRDDVSKHETAISEEFEAHMSPLLKRKRELESGFYDKETVLVPTEAQLSMQKSFSEIENGELCKDDDNSNVDKSPGTCTSVSSQEDFAVASPSSAKEEVSERLRRFSGKAVEFETESSEEGSNFDVEMEGNAYGCEDYEMEESAYGCEDYEMEDDEDDFAKQIGRFFGLSNE